MSNKETTVEEWKTIRIPATAYYKLAELSGLMTAVFGMKIPMSVIANWAIIVYHDEYYLKLRNTMMKPKKIKEIREKFGGEVKRLSELISNISFE